MPTYAILGATSQTGSESLKLLLPTSAHLNVYARSASRLQLKHPTPSSAPNVTMFIGELSDTALLASCLLDAVTVFSTVAQNQTEPGCSIPQPQPGLLYELSRRGESRGHALWLCSWHPSQLTQTKRATERGMGNLSVRSFIMSIPILKRQSSFSDPTGGFRSSSARPVLWCTMKLEEWNLRETPGRLSALVSPGPCEGHDHDGRRLGQMDWKVRRYGGE